MEEDLEFRLAQEEQKAEERCELCEYKYNSGRRLDTHHQLYEPEIVVKLCVSCHNMLHRLSSLREEKRNVVLSWISRYSSNWHNGTEKYNKTEVVKKRNRDWWARLKSNQVRLQAFYNNRSMQRNLNKLSLEDCSALEKLILERKIVNGQRVS